MGQTAVPTTPERVVVLDNAALDAAIALQIKPIGASAYGGLPQYLGEVTAGITLVGDANQSNLEAILQLKPDLILGTKISAGKTYRALSQIAPTVLSEENGRFGDWQDHFQLYAKVLGKADQAEILLETYQQRIQALQGQIDNPQDIQVSVIIPYDDRIITYTTSSFSGSVLNDVGFARNPAQVSQRRFALSLSREDLASLDGDLVFLITDSPAVSQATKIAFSQDPVWSQLQAVQQDRLCNVDVEVWTAGRSILAALQILDDIEACLP
ncbi:MAG: iron-siderophore ABC transporter substrate-binding protein [Leptolyngbyaceae cyanobacterium SM2_5_2]|nr:iron-siderophore ABC transporter substrate-binding protein [Leptolyngbyaceae cyanobacterium SM2_5_2]